MNRITRKKYRIIIDKDDVTMKKDYTKDDFLNEYDWGTY